MQTTTNTGEAENYQIITVILPIHCKKNFSYKLPANHAYKIGQLLSVPLGKKKLVGAISDLHSDFISDKVKNVEQLHDIFLKPEFLLFLKSFAHYNMTSLGAAFKMSVNAFSTKSTATISPTAIETKSISLSPEQQRAFEYLLSHNNKPVVLEGVTGSGKTMVYLRLAEELLKASGQALILLPEIILTNQILKRIKNLLPHKTILQWHSALPLKKRHELWQIAIRGEDVIVIGARSALFLPFINLKLIVVDEEHDASFKQSEGVIYNTRDMAILRGNIEQCRVLLTSATPSIETLHNIDNKKYYYVSLDNRFSGVSMPDTRLIDMNHEKTKKNHFLSTPVRAALKEQLCAGKQSLIFLNRKGYAPIAICASCGTKAKCPNCSSWLVFYKCKQYLACHYCGYHSSTYSNCANCQSSNIIFYGPGIERIEEEVRSFLPEARLFVATGDTISSAKAAHSLIQQITNHELDIIIGTQVISKGLDFKLLQLVCVVDADCNYTTGDIRAHERMYQLLRQVSGRSGRDQKQGMVLMQTYEPNHHVLNSIVKFDKTSFIRSEMEDRKAAQMPPFTRLAIINMSCINEYRLVEFAHMLAEVMQPTNLIKIMGPAASPMSFLKKEFRYRFILKAAKNINLQKAICDWLSMVKIPYNIKIKVDIDPYNFS